MKRILALAILVSMLLVACDDEDKRSHAYWFKEARKEQLK